MKDLNQSYSKLNNVEDGKSTEYLINLEPTAK
jgi:hypothetical protein